MRRILAVVVTGLAAIGLLSACAGRSGSPAGTPAAQPTSAQATATAKAPVNRPRQIKLDGIAPCSLLTPTQAQQQLKTDRSRPVFDDGLKVQACRYYLTGGVYTIALITNESANSWTDGSRAGQAQSQAPIAGFPTISHTVAGNNGGCDVVVDAADNGYLIAGIQVLPGAESRFPEKCAAASQAAEAAMTTLLASH